MTPNEAIEALGRIIDASISDSARRQAVKDELARLFNEHHQVPAKGILADCQTFGDKEVGPEIRELIKQVCFYYV